VKGETAAEGTEEGGDDRSLDCMIGGGRGERLLYTRFQVYCERTHAYIRLK
jgi:hypothetical protein